jgi:hypothetical protein
MPTKRTRAPRNIAQRIAASATIRELVRPSFDAARKRLLAAVLELHHAGEEYLGIVGELQHRNVNFAMLGPLPIPFIMGGPASPLSTMVHACRAEGLITWAQIPEKLK